MTGEDPHQITKRSGSNLAFALRLLPKERRSAMGVYYAFCRVIDDVADAEGVDPEVKRKELLDWREEIAKVYEGEPVTPLGKALKKVAQQYDIPQKYLQDLISGVEMDLVRNRYQTFKELELYCYRVASVVGLTSIKIFGCKNEQSEQYAYNLGMAFQLTNIIRDIKKDAQTGRIYLPQEEIERFGYSEKELFQEVRNEAFLDLMHFQAARAEFYYNEALSYFTLEDKQALISAEMMERIYHELLRRLVQEDFPSLHRQISLSKSTKLWMLFKTWKDYKHIKPQGRKEPVTIIGDDLTAAAAAVKAASLGIKVRWIRRGDKKKSSLYMLIPAGAQSCLEFFKILGWQHRLKVFKLPVLEIRTPDQTLEFTLSGKGIIEPRAGASSGTALTHGLRHAWEAEQYRMESKTVSTWAEEARQSIDLQQTVWETTTANLLGLRAVDAGARSLLEGLEMLKKGGPLSYFSGNDNAREEILERAEEMTRAFGGEVEVCEVKLINPEVKKVQIEKADGTTHEVLRAILALPWQELDVVLPHKVSQEDYFRFLERLECTREVRVVIECTGTPTSLEPQLILLTDTTFSRAELLGNRIIAVCPNAQDYSDLSDEKTGDLAIEELRKMKVIGEEQAVSVVKVEKVRGMLKCGPRMTHERPFYETPFPSLFIGADWCQTGLPPSLEGEIRAGFAVVSLLGGTKKTERVVYRPDSR
ncbi:MAG: presqualene diphosphate synthase HpnD [Verrucomicrobiota bacterium]|nr:presqualene diphosphate synthase HpnD [Verrucomicrobiota bacterium]